MSALIRRKQRKQELEAIKERLKNNLPVLDKRQIRRHRISYEDALLLELEEDGFNESAAYLKSLLDYQIDMRTKAGEDSYIWRKPLLKDHHEILHKLYKGLKETEMALKTSQKTLEIDHLLALGLQFSSDNDDDSWWWLGEQILLQTLELAAHYYDDGGQRHALVRFFYGRFLLKNLKHYQEAESNLRICRDQTLGRLWTVTDFLHTEKSSKILFKECCYLLYQTLLEIAILILNTDPEQANKLCNVALKRATEAQNIASQSECIYHIGMCEMKLENYNSAINNFQKVLIMFYSTNDKVGVCETRIRLAAANAKLDRTREATYHLNNLLDYAIKQNMKFYEALAHRYIGELFLHNFMSGEAGPHLLKALEMFHELDDYDNREQAKNLAAIANGFQMMLPYRELIHSCANKSKEGEESLMKMVRWKDIREPFYEEQFTSTEISSVTTEEIKYFSTCEEWGEEEEDIEMKQLAPLNSEEDVAFNY